MTAPAAAQRANPVRIGVLGCAGIAWRRTLPAMLATPEVAVAAVASRDPEKARRFAERFGARPVDSYTDLLARDDIEAVYVPLPTGLHHEWVTAALHAGKHVLAEKPLATTLAEATELVELADKAELVLHENFMFLHHAQHAAVRRLLDEGAIGTLRAFSAAFGIPPLPDTDVRYRPELGGGALLDVGVYPLRAAQVFLDGPLTVLGASLTGAGLAGPQGADGTGVDVAGAALLRAEGGATASLTFGFQHHYRNAYELWGSAGRITVDRVFTPPGTWAPIVRVERAGHAEEHTLPAQEQFATAVAAFARSVRDPASPQGNDGAAILRQAALVDAVRAAAGR